MILIIYNKRPLTDRQINYAALDSAILIVLLGHIIQAKSLNIVLSSVKSIHFELVDNLFQEDFSHRRQASSAKRTKLKRMLGFWFLCETWTHSSTCDNDVPSPAMREKQISNRSKSKKMGHSLSDVFLNTACLPHIGEALSFTQDQCLQRLVFPDRPLDLNDSFTFNKRAGMVQLANAWAVFLRLRTKFSDFSNGGQHLDLVVSLKSSYQCRILRDIDETSESRRRIFLFICFTTGKYMFCGECRCASKSIVQDSLKLTMVLETTLLAHDVMKSSNILQGST